MNLSQLKSSYVIPVLCLLVAVWALVVRSNFSLIDMIADRAIQKIEAKYSPYGPGGAPKPAAGATQ